MSNNFPTSGEPRSHANVPDLPLIIEQLQDQLDDLAAAVRALQSQLDRQEARIASLERA